MKNFLFIHLLQNVCELFFVYILVHLPCNFKLFFKLRNLVYQLNANGNWGKQRLCRKVSILDVARVLHPLLRGSLNISKKIKVRFWYFYCLSIKIRSITMLSPDFYYKFFYLSVMLANIFRSLMVVFFQNPRSPPDFCQATIFLKVYLFLYFFVWN